MGIMFAPAAESLDPVASPQVGDQADKEQHEKQDEQNFRHTGGGEGDSSEAKEAGDNRDHQKYQRVVQHALPLSLAYQLITARPEDGSRQFERTHG